MPEQIKIPVITPETASRETSVPIRRDLGSRAVDSTEVFQVPVIPEVGAGGELILIAPETGEEVYHGDVNAASDEFDLAA